MSVCVVASAVTAPAHAMPPTFLLLLLVTLVPTYAPRYTSENYYPKENDPEEVGLHMKQADELIERILFLEGLPNLQQLERLRIGEHCAEMMQCDLDLEMEQLALLREVIAECENAGDYISRHLLEEILEGEEEYVDWIEAQQHLIRETGIENYLQSAIEKE